jgi:F0F1-type ATP synthase assembly protein I
MSAEPDPKAGKTGNTSEQDKKDTKKQESSYSPYIRFSSMAVQMGLLIGLGAWGGTELDERAQNEKPVYTIVLCLLAIGISLYLVIREASKLSKDDK